MGSITQDVANTIVTGQGTIGETATVMASSTHNATRGVLIIPAATNAGTIYAGLAAVSTATGVVVPAAGLTIPIGRAANIYLIASAADQDYSYMIV